MSPAPASLLGRGLMRDREWWWFQGHGSAYEAYAFRGLMLILAVICSPVALLGWLLRRRDDVQ